MSSSDSDAEGDTFQSQTRERSSTEEYQSPADVLARKLRVDLDSLTQHEDSTRDLQSTSSHTHHVPHGGSDIITSRRPQRSDRGPVDTPPDSTSESGDGPLRSLSEVDVLETLPLGLSSFPGDGTSQSDIAAGQSTSALVNPELSTSLGIDLGPITSTRGLVDLGPSTSTGLVGVLGAHSAQFRPDLWPRVTPESLSLTMDEQSESSSSQGSPSPTSSTASYNPFPG